MHLPVFPLVPPASTGRPGFSSPKCLPIQYPRRACRDFLVLASLDPATSHILPSQVAPRHLPVDCYFSVQLTRTLGELTVLLCENTDGTHLLADRSFGVALPRRALNSPSIETARIVWSRRNHQVDPAFSVLIQKRLEQSGGMTFGQAIELEGFPPGEASNWAMALACRGLLDLHIDGHLGPETRVTPRPRPQQAPSNLIK